MIVLLNKLLFEWAIIIIMIITHINDSPLITFSLRWYLPSIHYYTTVYNITIGIQHKCIHRDITYKNKFYNINTINKTVGSLG